LNNFNENCLEACFDLHLKSRSEFILEAVLEVANKKLTSYAKSETELKPSCIKITIAKKCPFLTTSQKLLGFTAILFFINCFSK
jgi:hypothetical protein